MKKIAILTWLHNGNYGSILQAYALQRFLAESGYEVKNIDYNPTALERVKNLFQSRNSLMLFYEKFQAKLSRTTPEAKEYNGQKEMKFEQFLRYNFNLTAPIRKTKDLQALAGKFDAYICGSDQIWSPMLLNPAFYLDFLKDGDKKISYACSFGVSQIPTGKQEIIGRLLKNFDSVSVREFQGEKIVEDLTEQKCEVLCDPTFLLTKSQWAGIAGLRKIQENYCLLYMLSYHKEYWNHAIRYAHSLGLKVIMIPVTKESYGAGIELAKGASPEDWVNLVMNASMVLTDSFHGCVFSLIFNRPFFVYRRFNDQNIKSQNSRVNTLLDQFDQKKRIIDKYNSFPDFLDDMSEASIQCMIDRYREKSEKWLSKAIVGEN